MLAQPASASAPARTRPPAMKSLWCERVVILLLPVLAIGIETPRRRVSIRPADDARICCPFQGDSRVFGREAAGGDWTIRLERSEARRVGKEWVRTFRARWSPAH